MPLEVLQNGRYRRLRLLGSGGMGEAYLMEDTRLNKQVAIKVIQTEAGSYTDSDAARLFQREARAIAALDHPNILPLYDFGEEALDGARLTYMVMPYCAEGSFADWLRKRGSTTLLSPQDVASFITQAADALQYAHDRQIMHLDVKPSNFLLRSNRKDPTHPTLLLADFGVARLGAAATSSSFTVRVTPTSMAPEQWGSTPVPATDQYALAIMAYELLVGRPPFQGNMEQLMYQHFQAQAPAPSTFNPRLTAAIDEVLLRALAKRPQDRFPTISAFAAALEQAVKSLPTQATLRPAGAGPNPPPPGRASDPNLPPIIAPSSPPPRPATPAPSPAQSPTPVVSDLHLPSTVRASDPTLPPIITPPPPRQAPPAPSPAQGPTPVGFDLHLPSTVRASNPNLPTTSPPPPPPLVSREAARSSGPGLPSIFVEASEALAKFFSRRGSRKQPETQLSLFAIARTTLEADDRAIVGKVYTVQAGVSQNRPADFRGEPFRVSVQNPAEPLLFGILLHPSENIELMGAWYQRLSYNPRNAEPQFISCPFRLKAPGRGYLVINFYRERQWLKTMRFEFDGIEQSVLSTAMRGR